MPPILPDSDYRGQWPEAGNYVFETGGHAPSLFAKTLCEWLPIQPRETRLLDVGCGCGIVGLFCLIERAAAYVTFNDIQEEMILIAQDNVARQIAKGVISDSRVGYLKRNFVEIASQFAEQHDLISFNPPQLPTEALDHQTLEQISGDPSLSYFRLGGLDGLDVVRKFLKWYSNLDATAPRAIIMISSFLGISRIRSAMESDCLDWDIIARNRVPLRSILSRAAKSLTSDEREDRLLEPNSQGGWSKELLVISAQQKPQAKTPRVKPQSGAPRSNGE